MKRRFSSFIGMILVCAVTMAQAVFLSSWKVAEVKLTSLTY